MATSTLRKLVLYRVMRGSETLAGRQLRSLCVQAWVQRSRRRRPRRGAFVLLSDGERLYDLGAGVRVWPGRHLAGRATRQRFVLAGCPRFLGNLLAARLTRATEVEVRPTRTKRRAAYIVRFGPRRQPIDLYVHTVTFAPLELRLGGTGAGLRSVRPGGGTPAALRLERAFDLTPR